MQLLGLFNLLPVSLLLTYMALRRASLLPGVAAHFAFNLTGVALGLAGLNLPVLVTGLLVCGLLIYGPAAGGWALAAFLRTPPAAPAPRARSLGGTWWGQYWPLLLAGLLFLVVGAFELILAAQRAAG
jgi:hypothetical protein